MQQDAMVQEQVPFINREAELAQIETCIGAWGTRQWVYINADGGIGKTRLLQEVHRRYSTQAAPASTKDMPQVPLLVTDIIDFDDRSFYIPQNVGRKIAQMLDDKGKTLAFVPYFEALLDWRRMEMEGWRKERLEAEGSVVDSAFETCFNRASTKNRVVLLFDTTDAIDLGTFSDYLTRTALALENVVIVLAGRNAGNMWESLATQTDEHVVFINLAPLDVEASEAYLKAKEDMLLINVEPELAEKLLFFSQGRPILIDLAIEWRTRGISLEWLIHGSLDEIKALPQEKQKERQEEFERQLLQHIADTRRPIDWLLLTMSRIYPLKKEMLIALLDMEDTEAEELFQEALGYVFVKQLPDGRISLHDEMRRMVNEYVWPETDPDSYERRQDSSVAVQYLTHETENLAQRIKQLALTEKQALEQGDAVANLHAFMKRETLESELWILREQLLEHALFADMNEGITTFVQLFDLSNYTFRFTVGSTLLKLVEEYADSLSDEQRYAIDSRRVKHAFQCGEYAQAKILATEILEQELPSPEHRIDMLLQRGNAEIRLGDVDTARADFEETLRLSEEHDLTPWRIRSMNALGWAHRLVGDLRSAAQYYRRALDLCEEKGMMGYDYGLILNNLTFVLSDQYHKNAIGFGLSAVEHWQSLGNKQGECGAYGALSIAYYRNGVDQKALDALQKALDISESLNLYDLTARNLSWRGAVHQNLGNFAQAEEDLKRSIEDGPRDIQAMSLNRLGRVYMSQGRWDEGEDCLQQSYAVSQEIPDYTYWIVSLSRLITIAAVRHEYERLEEFRAKLQEYVDTTKSTERNSLGIAYLGLGRLALGCGDVETAITFLQDGIALITEYGSYARADIFSRLEHIEEDFEQVDADVLHRVGQELIPFLRKQESDTGNMAYGMISSRIRGRWLNRGEHTQNPEPVT